jgi:hypothetical protein
MPRCPRAQGGVGCRHSGPARDFTSSGFQPSAHGGHRRFRDVVPTRAPAPRGRVVLGRRRSGRGPGGSRRGVCTSAGAMGARGADGVARSLGVHGGAQRVAPCSTQSRARAAAPPAEPAPGGSRSRARGRSVGLGTRTAASGAHRGRLAVRRRLHRGPDRRGDGRAAQHRVGPPATRPRSTGRAAPGSRAGGGGLRR